MTTALFLADRKAVAGVAEGGLVELSGEEGRHAVAVQRIGPGQPIDVGDGVGTILHATVESVAGKSSLLARVGRREEQPHPRPRIVVVQALPKGERGEAAIGTMTEVGVDMFVPWQAERCIARWSGERAERGRAKWSNAARAATKQSHRAWQPDVAEVAASPRVAQLLAGAGAAIVLHEAATRPLAGVDLPDDGDIVVVVGPEGGLSPAELAVFSGTGSHVARMGPHVLRTSTAGTVAAALILARTSRWG